MNKAFPAIRLFAIQTSNFQAKSQLNHRLIALSHVWIYSTLPHCIGPYKTMTYNCICQGKVAIVPQGLCSSIAVFY